MSELLEERRAPTLEDWLAIPETNQKIEFIEGSLFHMAPPTMRHQRIAFRLEMLLDQSNPTPNELWVAHECGALVGRNGFKPDVLVSRPTNAAMTTGDLLVLHAEIESPSSLGNDRVLKPNVLARHGIPSYWRIEPDPIVVHIYELDGDAYVETQTASGDEEITVTKPWPLSFRPSQLEP